MCCLYNNEINTDSIVCMQPHTFDLVWWDVSVGLGIFILLYFPLFFFFFFFLNYLEFCLRKLGNRLLWPMQKSNIQLMT